MGWISVDDQLPEGENVFLVSNEDGDIFSGYRRGLFYFCKCNGDYIYERITHWMPLPQPPKETK